VIPQELPQEDVAQVDKLSDELIRPAMEDAQDEQRRQQKWAGDVLNQIDQGVRDIDNFQPGTAPEVKKNMLIRGLLDVKFNSQPESVEAYESAREQAAVDLKFPEGAGASDDAFFAEMQKQSEIKKNSEDVQKEVREAAYMSALGEGDFNTWAQGQSMSEPRKQSHLMTWQGHQEDLKEHFGDVLPKINKTFKLFKEGKKDEAKEYADMVLMGVDQEEEDLFFAGLREVVVANPDPQIAEIFKAMGVNIFAVNSLQSNINYSKAADKFTDIFKGVPIGAIDLINSPRFMQYIGESSTPEQLERKIKNAEDLVHSNNIEAKIGRIFSNE